MLPTKVTGSFLRPPFRGSIIILVSGTACIGVALGCYVLLAGGGGGSTPALGASHPGARVLSGVVLVLLSVGLAMAALFWPGGRERFAERIWSFVLLGGLVIVL